MATIQQLLTEGRQSLDSDSAALDVELLLASVLGKSRTYLYTWPEKEVAVEALDAFQSMLSQRLKGVPVAYLLGSREFWSLQLKVTPDTLIPRPETELLVEAALELLPSSPQCVLDLGTGTGAIALALASEREHWQLLAVDRVSEAAALAEINRRLCGVENVRVVQGSWGDAVAPGCWHMIVSNPPYIDQDDPHLRQGDVRYEPSSALVAARQGLADIESVCCQSLTLLVDGGWLLLEHGYRQGCDVQRLMTELGYDEIKTLKDLSGQDRVTRGRKAVQR